MSYLGATLTELRPGFCEISVPFDERLTQQHGLFHAGVIGTIADSAGGYAGYTLMPAESEVLTVEYKLSLLAPAYGDELKARGQVVRQGRTLVFTECDVITRHDGHDKRCAQMTQTLINTRKPSRTPAVG